MEVTFVEAFMEASVEVAFVEASVESFKEASVEANSLEASTQNVLGCNLPRKLQRHGSVDASIEASMLPQKLSRASTKNADSADGPLGEGL